MKSLTFSHDYEKLPVVWEGTEAILVGVCEINAQYIKNALPAFYHYDTAFRDESGNYELNFEAALVLSFIHINTGKPFTTVRRHYPAKADYYMKALGETFILKRVDGK